MRSLCLKVPKGKGEEIRKKLLEKGLLDIALRVRREGEALLLPVISDEARTLGHEVIEEEFEYIGMAHSDYKELVEVPEGLRPLLPTSFDVIGDIAIIKLPEELLPFSPSIGKALRESLPHIRTVAVDQGVKGEMRVRQLDVISGGPGTETTHTEYGIRLLIDPAKAYFNPRLSNERKRVASMVREGEIVVDMFAGVGPFAVMIAKHAKPEKVYAIDLNPAAVSYLKKNIELNKVRNVEAKEGDAREIIKQLPLADRIIMNLPHSALEFLPAALMRLKLGGMIHLYHICSRSEVEEAVKKLLQSALGMGHRVEVLRAEELKTYSPSMSVYAIDLRLAERV
ncbi:MAG: class I SAM-dependent methyltransferase family protein [Methanomassiliicoccales archaeon]